MYDSDRHIYFTTERGTKVRAFYVTEGEYLVETHADLGRRAPEDDQTAWDIPIGFVRRNPLTKCTERFSLLTRDNKPARGATTAIRELAESYDKATLGERPAFNS